MFIRNYSTKINNLKGVGNSAKDSYSSLGVNSYGDLLYLTPRDREDRTKLINLENLPKHFNEAIQVNTFVLIKSHSFFGAFSKSGKTLKIKVESYFGNRTLSLLCFGRNFLQKIIKTDKLYYLYATVYSHNGELQASSFELFEIKDIDNPPPPFGQIIPLYPLKGSLTQKLIKKNIIEVLSQPIKFEDELPQYIMDELNLMPFDKAIRSYHFPKNKENLNKARETLAFNELFYMQIIARKDISIHTTKENIKSIPSELELKLISNLPFKLTNDQLNSLKEIRYDLDKSAPMNRMLQGDVGAGKTLIAWASALHEISKKHQIAFMAPTELLANQHAQNAAELLEPLGISIALLTGSVSKKQRKPILEGIKNNTIQLLIGTHALFSDNVEFKNLRYIIIDEQHRFGVNQREKLLSKGIKPNILMMSATPIPRSLALTVYGDLNVSTIKNLPMGRKPIITHLVSEKSRKRMYEAIGVEFKRGHQAYFVYPRIDDSGSQELRDVTNMFEYLKKEYPNIPSALLHSKIDDDEKIKILNKFKKGEISYLVSTSVIEVGIDVPNATCMIIEHADIFGLSALHQLRGRVGRSILQSYSFLVFDDNISELGKERLKVMRETNDGFTIAEKDLVLRGPGDILGTKQSGFLRLHFASLVNDLKMIKIARKYCDKILLEDPNFINIENLIIKRVLKESNPFEEK
ncbi:MAG: ATP-dependent DNA helicase RecG [Pleomorphochaeta sp.]